MGILLFMAGVQTFAEPSYTSKFSDWGNLLKQYANDENGNEMGAFTGQLALQYAYADGQEKSCSLVIGQVADILKNEVPINEFKLYRNCE